MLWPAEAIVAAEKPWIYQPRMGQARTVGRVAWAPESTMLTLQNGNRTVQSWSTGCKSHEVLAGIWVAFLRECQQDERCGQGTACWVMWSGLVRRRGATKCSPSAYA